MPQERRRFKFDSGGHRLHLAHFLACFDLPHIMDDVNFRSTDMVGEDDQAAWNSVQGPLNAPLPPGAVTRIVRENISNKITKLTKEVNELREERKIERKKFMHYTDLVKEANECKEERRNERKKYLLYNDFRLDALKSKYLRNNLEEAKKDFAMEILIATMTDM